MDDVLKDRLVEALQKFRKLSISYALSLGVRMNELHILKGIAENASGDERQCVNVSDIQSTMHITKPAVSQMLKALEKKGYIARETDKNDRRRVEVTLTAEGKEILRKGGAEADAMIEKVVARFGEENTVKLTELFNRLAEIMDDLKQEASYTDKKGEN